jgi:hypothetical protein
VLVHLHAPTVGIGQIRFGDTCTEAKNFFEWSEMVHSCVSALTRMVLDVNVEIMPRDMKD